MRADLLALTPESLAALANAGLVKRAQKELQQICGGGTVFEVDWDTFADDADALNNVQNQGLRRINAALRKAAGI